MGHWLLKARLEDLFSEPTTTLYTSKDAEKDETDASEKGEVKCCKETGQNFKIRNKNII